MKKNDLTLLITLLSSSLLMTQSCAEVSSIEQSMQERGFTWASPHIDFQLGEHDQKSELLYVNNNFHMNIPEDKQKDITYIITQMGTKSKPALLFSAGKLNRKGKNIEGVPTLQFLGYIFHNPQLKGYMRNIRADSFKWNRMIEGIRNGLTTQANNGSLNAQLQGFSSYVGAPYDALKAQVDARNWDGFMAVLLNS